MIILGLSLIRSSESENGHFFVFFVTEINIRQTKKIQKNCNIIWNQKCNAFNHNLRKQRS